MLNVNMPLSSHVPEQLPSLTQPRTQVVLYLPKCHPHTKHALHSGPERPYVHYHYCRRVLRVTQNPDMPWSHFLPEEKPVRLFFLPV